MAIKINSFCFIYPAKFCMGGNTTCLSDPGLGGKAWGSNLWYLYEQGEESSLDMYTGSLGCMLSYRVVMSSILLCCSSVAESRSDDPELTVSLHEESGDSGRMASSNRFGGCLWWAGSDVARENSPKPTCFFTDWGAVLGYLV